MKAHINSYDKLNKKGQAVVRNAAVTLADQYIAERHEQILSRHLNMSILALSELGWGKTRLDRFIDEFNKQIKRLAFYENDLEDFDYKLDCEVKKLGVVFEKVA